MLAWVQVSDCLSLVPFPAVGSEWSTRTTWTWWSDTSCSHLQYTARLPAVWQVCPCHIHVPQQCAQRLTT